MEYNIWRPANIYDSAQIGKGTNIGMFAEVGKNVKIGKNCKIGGHAFIPEGVTIEDDVFVGPHVMFCNDKHPRAYGDWKVIPTLVKQGASVGANSTILPGVTIGRYASLGAGSVLTHDIPDGEIWCGNAAKRMCKV